MRKEQLMQIAPGRDQLCYAHLWWPIALLARLVEWLLVQMRALTGFKWRVTIVLFTLILKLLLVPLGLITIRWQRQVSLFQGRLAPAGELTRQKRNHYRIARMFFVLLYPVPAAMVLYWTLSNALQIVQQRVIKI
jgi:membrane protein insertase Oxa1/YidC/SpoIIIJ